MKKINKKVGTDLKQYIGLRIADLSAYGMFGRRYDMEGAEVIKIKYNVETLLNWQDEEYEGYVYYVTVRTISGEELTRKFGEELETADTLEQLKTSGAARADEAFRRKEEEYRQQVIKEMEEEDKKRKVRNNTKEGYKEAFDKGLKRRLRIYETMLKNKPQKVKQLAETSKLSETKLKRKQVNKYITEYYIPLNNEDNEVYILTDFALFIFRRNHRFEKHVTLYSLTSGTIKDGEYMLSAYAKKLPKEQASILMEVARNLRVRK